MNEPDDRTLVDAIVRHGNRRAFGVLYDRHTPYLYRFALRLCGGVEADAQDIVHDAWIDATARLSSFQWRASLRTWLAGFIVNGARKAMRTQDRMAVFDGNTVSTDDAVITGVHDRVDLERAIATLPPGGRHVFVLHDVEGWTHEDIGRQLGIDPGTSKSQLSRARALLRSRLASGRSDT